VLILTAIVVGVAVTAVALTLVVRIYGEYGTLREDIIRQLREETRR
jgi:multicomponent Na+:H+ antiporter subunit C